MWGTVEEKLKEILSDHMPLFQDLNDSGDLDNAVLKQGWTSRLRYNSYIQLTGFVDGKDTEWRRQLSLHLTQMGDCPIHDSQIT